MGRFSFLDAFVLITVALSLLCNSDVKNKTEMPHPKKQNQSFCLFFLPFGEEWKTKTSHAGEDRETPQASTTNKLTSVTTVLLELSLGEF